MRVLVRSPVSFAIVGLAALLSARAFAQGETPDEVTVRGQKTLTQYRLELERARDWGRQLGHDLAAAAPSGS